MGGQKVNSRTRSGRRQKLFDAGVLCPCGSHDVRRITRAKIDRLDQNYRWVNRPLFGCGSCGATWTSGNAGEPYIRFARKDGDWEWP